MAKTLQLELLWEYLIGNDAFQEVDIVGITRNVAKFVIMVRDREMLAQRIKEAFYIARF